MVTQLKVEARNVTTKAELTQLRANGKIPGVVYGKKIEASAIAVKEKELMALLRTNPHAIVEIDVPELGKQSVMVNEIQRDALYRNLLHIDFHQISMDEPVKTTVRLDLAGEPKGLKQGGMLQVHIHEVEVKCLPQHLPAAIEVDISGLEIGDSLLVRDLKVPADLEIRTDANEMIAAVLTPQKDVEEKAEPETAAQEANKPQDGDEGANNE